jgi:hypothetical protein
MSGNWRLPFEPWRTHAFAGNIEEETVPAQCISRLDTSSGRVESWKRWTKGRFGLICLGYIGRWPNDLSMGHHGEPRSFLRP